MRVYEENYRLLVGLLPGWEGGACYRMAGDGQTPDIELRVLERHKYTTTLELKKSFGADGGELVPDLLMRVRIYDDARVAEVTGYQDCQRIPPRYAVEDAGRFAKDEKSQVNHLLHELLRYCIRRRRTTGFSADR